MKNVIEKVLKGCIAPLNFFLRPWGYYFGKIPPLAPSPTFNQGGLTSFHNCDFMKDPKFISAYERGIKANESDDKIAWKVHVALWAASQAIRLQGAFVECGVNRGFISSAIMHYLNWNQHNRHFYLFDTFCGLDESLLSPQEIVLGRIEQGRSQYTECYEKTVKNFSEYQNVHLIRGSVPSILSLTDIPSVSYLSLDLNSAMPEAAAAKFFWPKLEKGALILLDNYAQTGCEPQKEALDKIANEIDVEILTFPTGQGLIIKL